MKPHECRYVYGDGIRTCANPAEYGYQPVRGDAYARTYRCSEHVAESYDPELPHYSARLHSDGEESGPDAGAERSGRGCLFGLWYVTSRSRALCGPFGTGAEALTYTAEVRGLLEAERRYGDAWEVTVTRMVDSAEIDETTALRVREHVRAQRAQREAARATTTEKKPRGRKRA